MPDIGSAYVQIIPSARGISGKISEALGGEAETAGHQAGESFAKKFGSIATKAIAALGIGKLIGESLNQGGQLQQSLGGVETLFKENADKVKAYAADSFRTTGLSANEYMQNVTSFSASLLQSLGGDTSRAADLSNMAMTDMADNANKMGTSMEAITTAYQGFAKQNYTMLDNLKLGYGGTKSEMERLLRDAEAISGVHYDISNLSDVYEAIHVIQGELGITGTTALEASQTLEGSFNSMKAAFTDLLGQMSTGGDISTALMNLTTTVSTYLFGNFLPMVSQILQNVPMLIVGAVQGIAEHTGEIVNAGVNLVVGLITGIITAVPQLITAVNQLAASIWQTITTTDWVALGQSVLQNIDTGVLDQIPTIISTIGEMIVNLIDTIMQNLPQFWEKGSELIVQMISGITSRLPQIAASIGEVLANLIRTIVSNLPQFMAKGIELVVNIARGLIQAIPTVLSSIGSIISQAASAFTSFNWFSIGSNIISGIVNGIWSLAGAIGNALMSIARNAWGAIKSFFGISSPSKLMRDTIGRYIPEGMAEGIEENAKYVTDAMESMANDAVEMPIEQSLAYRPAEAASGTTNTTNYGGVVINVNAADYSDPEALAEYIKNYLTNDIRREGEVYA